jgi:K+-sensing histidine kinase KdpD
MKTKELVYIFETQVIDTGDGISKDRQKLLFVPLAEIRESIGGLTSKNENIGLGLSCCKVMSNKMGGDITVK